MPYHHTVLVPKTLVFERQLLKCPVCHEMMDKHIICEGARFHVLSWDSLGEHCSCKDCEKNHETKHRHEKQEKCTHQWVYGKYMENLFGYTGKVCSKCGKPQKLPIIVRY